MYESLIVSRKLELAEILENQKLFNIKTGLSFYLKDISPNNAFNDERSIVAKIVAELNLKKPTNGAEMHNLCRTTADLQNYSAVWRARKAIDDIRKLNIEKIKINEDLFFKEYHQIKVMELFNEYNFRSLIATEEISNYTNFN